MSDKLPFRVLTTAELIAEAEKQAASEIPFSVEKDRFLIDGHYWIDFDRCDTPEKILGWAEHLAEKTWVNTTLLRTFIRSAAHRINCHIYGM
jgi:hypothetical protein